MRHLEREEFEAKVRFVEPVSMTTILDHPAQAGEAARQIFLLVLDDEDGAEEGLGHGGELF
jgi:hypothetical protein